MIQLKETVQGELEVTGTYNEMQPILSKLKSRGFMWNPSTRVWHISRSRLTDAQYKNLQKLLGGSNEAKAEKVKVDSEVNQKLFDRALEKSKEFIGLRFERKPTGAISLFGRVSDVYKDAKEAGGLYNSQTFLFTFADTKPKEFEQLLDKIETVCHRWAVQVAMLKDYLTPSKKWPTLNLRMWFDAARSRIVIDGDTKPVKDQVQRYLDHVRWDPSMGWAVPYLDTSKNEVETLCKYFDELEEKAVNAPKVEAQPRMQPKRPNTKGDYCRTCGGYVKPGDGYIIRVYDPLLAERKGYEDDMVWVVYHNDKSVCESVKAEREIREHEARNKQEARTNLSRLCETSANYVQGTGLHPQGEQIFISGRGHVIYGGGVWVVLEPNGTHFWYVKNNGADGDSWAGNNVATGGAGALGYRLDLTPEAKILIDVAKES